MIIRAKDAEKDATFAVAKQMVAAIKTAPKGHGLDDVEAIILDGDEKEALTTAMRSKGEETGLGFFTRDAGNVDNSHCIILVAAKKKFTGLGDDCRFCGFENCADNAMADGRCAVVLTDLGIAIGSAVSIAADNRIDNRVLFSAGKTALEMNLFEKEVNVSFAIPLYVGAKSAFHDRPQV